MKILVTGPGEFSGDSLKTGWYNVEKADDGTEAQNRAFHGLLQCYWASGQHSYNVRNFEHFRELIKLYLGAGTERYYSLVDELGRVHKEPVVRYRVKSWAMYTKSERTNAIDNLIREMEQAGVQSKKFEEILKGLEGGGFAGAFMRQVEDYDEMEGFVQGLRHEDAGDRI